MQVATLIGEGLFTFGDRDGPFPVAGLQHVLGIAPWRPDLLAIADTYNHRIMRYDPEARTLEPWPLRR
ncbi:hypothetical protein [Thiohalorhabdus methylotrophus]|uniref:Uncharacterized protein n=1 Tax=Thiohalorhabdus methylotrophus TaxID=3242694 RepID=A0ABV4TXT6_9GAMM